MRHEVFFFSDLATLVDETTTLPWYVGNQIPSDKRHTPREVVPQFRKYIQNVGRINSTKSPTLGTGNISEPSFVTSWESAQSRVRVDQCVSAVRTVEMPVFICLLSSYSHVTGVGGTQSLW